MHHPAPQGAARTLVPQFPQARPLDSNGFQDSSSDVRTYHTYNDPLGYGFDGPLVREFQPQHDDFHRIDNRSALEFANPSWINRPEIPGLDATLIYNREPANTDKIVDGVTLLRAKKSDASKDSAKTAEKKLALLNELKVIAEKVSIYGVIAWVEADGMEGQRFVEAAKQGHPLFNPEKAQHELDANRESLSTFDAAHEQFLITLGHFFARMGGYDADEILASPALQHMVDDNGNRLYSIGNFLKFSSQFFFAALNRGKRAYFSSIIARSKFVHANNPRRHEKILETLSLSDPNLLRDLSIIPIKNSLLSYLQADQDLDPEIKQRLTVAINKIDHFEGFLVVLKKAQEIYPSLFAKIIEPLSADEILNFYHHVEVKDNNLAKQLISDEKLDSKIVAPFMRKLIRFLQAYEMDTEHFYRQLMLAEADENSNVVSAFAELLENIKQNHPEILKSLLAGEPREVLSALRKRLKIYNESLADYIPRTRQLFTKVVDVPGIDQGMIETSLLHVTEIKNKLAAVLPSFAALIPSFEDFAVTPMNPNEHENNSSFVTRVRTVDRGLLNAKYTISNYFIFAASTMLKTPLAWVKHTNSKRHDLQSKRQIESQNRAHLFPDSQQNPSPIFSKLKTSWALLAGGFFVSHDESKQTVSEWLQKIVTNFRVRFDPLMKWQLGQEDAEHRLSPKEFSEYLMLDFQQRTAAGTSGEVFANYNKIRLESLAAISPHDAEKALSKSQSEKNHYAGVEKGLKWISTGLESGLNSGLLLMASGLSSLASMSLFPQLWASEVSQTVAASSSSVGHYATIMAIPMILASHYAIYKSSTAVSRGIPAKILRDATSPKNLNTLKEYLVNWGIYVGKRYQTYFTLAWTGALIGTAAYSTFVGGHLLIADTLGLSGALQSDLSFVDTIFKELLQARKNMPWFLEKPIQGMMTIPQMVGFALEAQILSSIIKEFSGDTMGLFAGPANSTSDDSQKNKQNHSESYEEFVERMSQEGRLKKVAGHFADFYDALIKPKQSLTLKDLSQELASNIVATLQAPATPKKIEPLTQAQIDQLADQMVFGAQQTQPSLFEKAKSSISQFGQRLNDYREKTFVSSTSNFSAYDRLINHTIGLLGATTAVIGIYYMAGFQEQHLAWRFNCLTAFLGGIQTLHKYKEPIKEKLTPVLNRVLETTPMQFVVSEWDTLIAALRPVPVLGPLAAAFRGMPRFAAAAFNTFL